ncbi:hypothetical protein IFM89_011657 [Coptis chinensis]|uniref:Terpene synthase N-terminal domain-containing protein n=1 Tax=Coptis chinensis TaxID=261450 RepID=A0A835HTB1_9MAGN|nr:hypothetical protein IFM89_011657 [Coptis chinensis]
MLEGFYFQKLIQQVNVIKANLQSIQDGELSSSAYDTAWVALVQDIHGSDAPQFPSCLDWIINNQLPDGSWGDRSIFITYDRLSCTLACVVALKTWNIHPEGRKKGMAFLRQNMHKLKDEDPVHLPVGFEVIFPSLVEMAQNLGLEVLQDSPAYKDIYDQREQKLKRVPKEILHNVPTTLLYSLEGMPDLDWEKLLKLQHPNGSFLCSTASTAYALIQTKDEKCFNYLKEVVERFSGGVPHTYPVDLFERLWVVDRLERLGVSRYYTSEIKKCLDYVHRYWTPNGIGWARDVVNFDIDDTSLGFRILRLHGYDVKADAFQQFERRGQFFCYPGQISQGITEMLCFYRASQVSFPGEKILEDGKTFAAKFLREKQDMGQAADRWIVTKGLVGEVQYHLDVPWYSSLSRIETRYYIEQYGGDDDVWIAKVLYRWYEELSLRDFGHSKDGLLKSYFLAMANIFEPERATERLAWTQTAAMIEAVSIYFRESCIEQRKSFIQAFNDGIDHGNNRGHSHNYESYLVKSPRGAWKRNLPKSKTRCWKENWIEEPVINISIESLELQMHELLQQVTESKNSLDKEIKQTFWTVAKSYYYAANVEPATIDLHIAKVLFERVV